MLMTDEEKDVLQLLMAICECLGGNCISDEELDIILCESGEVH